MAKSEGEYRKVKQKYLFSKRGTQGAGKFAYVLECKHVETRFASDNTEVGAFIKCDICTADAELERKRQKRVEEIERQCPDTPFYMDEESWQKLLERVDAAEGRLLYFATAWDGFDSRLKALEAILEQLK